MWVAIIAVVILAGVFTSEVFWELTAGAAVCGFLIAAVQLDLGMALFTLLLLGACLFHWRTA